MPETTPHHCTEQCLDKQILIGRLEIAAWSGFSAEWVDWLVDIGALQVWRIGKQQRMVATKGMLIRAIEQNAELQKRATLRAVDRERAKK